MLTVRKQTNNLQHAGSVVQLFRVISSYYGRPLFGIEVNIALLAMVWPAAVPLATGGTHIEHLLHCTAHDNEA